MGQHLVMAWGCLFQRASVAMILFIFKRVEGTSLLRSHLFRSHFKVNETFTQLTFDFHTLAFAAFPSVQCSQCLCWLTDPWTRLWKLHKRLHT